MQWPPPPRCIHSCPPQGSLRTAARVWVRAVCTFPDVKQYCVIRVCGGAPLCVCVCVCMCVCVYSYVLSRVRLCSPMDYSPPASSVLRFSRQAYWSGLPFPAPRIGPTSPVSPALAGGSFTPLPPGKPFSIFSEGVLHLCSQLAHGFLSHSRDQPESIPWPRRLCLYCSHQPHVVWLLTETFN